MTVPRGESHASDTSSLQRGGVLSRHRVVVITAATLLLGIAAIAFAVIVLPKAWQAATGPSRQAGREYAAHVMQPQPGAAGWTKFDIDMRCIAAADRASTQGAQLDNGQHLAPGRIMSAEFRNACIDEAYRRLRPSR